MASKKRTSTDVMFVIGLFGVVGLIIFGVLVMAEIIPSPEGFMLILGPAIIALALFLVITAILNITKSDMSLLWKIMWILFCGVFGAIGAIAYLQIKYRGIFYVTLDAYFALYSGMDNENNGGNYTETDKPKTKKINTIALYGAVLMASCILMIHVAFYVQILNPCGGLDEPCCDGKFCNSKDLLCNSDGTCHPCGHYNKPCCDGEVCTFPLSECDTKGICSACGVINEPCCENGPDCMKAFICDSDRICRLK